MPHAKPSLRLFTNPAWLHDDSARSLKVVSTEHFPRREPVVKVRVSGAVTCLLVGMSARLAHEERRQAESQCRVREAEEERFGSQSVLGSDEACAHGERHAP